VFSVAMAVLKEAEQVSCPKSAAESGSSAPFGFEQMVCLLRQQLPERCGKDTELASRLIYSAMEMLPKLGGNKQLQKLEAKFKDFHIVTSTQTPATALEDLDTLCRDAECALRTARDKSSRLQKQLDQVNPSQGTVNHWRSLVLQSALEQRKAAAALTSATERLFATERMLESVKSELQAGLGELDRSLQRYL